MAGVKVKHFSDEFLKNKTVQGSIFLRMMADHIVKKSEPGTPKKTGRLRMDVLRQVLGLKGKIVWRKDYAAKMEQFVFRNYTTPGTGPRYAENGVKMAIKDTLKFARMSGLI